MGWSENIGVPVLLQNLIQKVVLTLVEPLNSGFHTFMIFRRNGATMCQAHLLSPVPGLKLRLCEAGGLLSTYLSGGWTGAICGGNSTMGLNNTGMYWSNFNSFIQTQTRLSQLMLVSWWVHIYGFHLWNGYWIFLPHWIVSCQNGESSLNKTDQYQSVFTAIVIVQKLITIMVAFILATSSYNDD